MKGRPTDKKNIEKLRKFLAREKKKKDANLKQPKQGVQPDR